MDGYKMDMGGWTLSPSHADAMADDGFDNR